MPANLRPFACCGRADPSAPRPRALRSPAGGAYSQLLSQQDEASLPLLRDFQRFTAYR